MNTQLIRSLQRGAVAFGFSVAMVGAAAAQTTTTTTAPSATTTTTAPATTNTTTQAAPATATTGTSAGSDDSKPLFDPNSRIYGARLFFYNLGTALTFNAQSKADRQLTLNEDFAKQMAVTTNTARLQDIARRKESHDQVIQQISADPNEKDRVAEALAREKIFAVTAEAAAQGPDAEKIARGVVDNATLSLARVTDQKGLPPDMEKQLQDSGLTPDQITQIRTAASQSWEQGYKAFQAIRDNGQNVQGLGKALDTAFQQGDLKSFGGQVFAGGPPPQFLDRLKAADTAAKADFFVKFGQDPKFAQQFGDVAKGFAKDFSQQQGPGQGDFSKFLPPQLANQIGQFQQSFQQKFADGNFDPNAFHQDFEKQFGDQLRQFQSQGGPNDHGQGGFFGGPQGGPNGQDKGQFQGGPQGNFPGGPQGQQGQFQGQGDFKGGPQGGQPNQQQQQFQGPKPGEQQNQDQFKGGPQGNQPNNQFQPGGGNGPQGGNQSFGGQNGGQQSPPGGGQNSGGNQSGGGQPQSGGGGSGSGGGSDNPSGGGGQH